MALNPRERRLKKEAAAAKKAAMRPRLQPPFPFSAAPTFDPWAFKVQNDPPKTKG